MAFRRKACVVMLVSVLTAVALAQDVPVGCGGFIQSTFPVDFTEIQVKLYSESGSLKYTTDCAPNNGYFLIPLYDRGVFSIRVESPEGWTVEPLQVVVEVDGETDQCSRGEDINFQFLGFSVLGKVVSVGHPVGPRGVGVALKQAGSTVQETTTSDDGRYVFKGVAPGSYQLYASHADWKVTHEPVELIVDNDFAHALPGLAVLGFDVQGTVFGGGDPVSGVQLLLYTDLEVVGCDLSSVPATAAGSPSCLAVSNDEGQFTFKHLPAGTYTLVPYYTKNKIPFEVQPTETNFTVFNDSVTILPPFEVQGFSVDGQILITRQGTGVEGAKIYVNGKVLARTDASGSYQLSNITTGTYKIQVEAVDLHFEPLEVHISPSNPSIPKIIPSRFSICGDVKIPLPPNESISAAFRSVEVLCTASGSVTTAQTGAKGDFCVMLALGEYKVKVMVSDEESVQGLLLLPAEHHVAMLERPVTTRMSFTQFTATLSGRISCLVNCPQMTVTLHRSSARKEPLGQRLSTKAKPKKKTADFTFTDVLPGSVSVSLEYPAWCWVHKALEVEVVLGKQRPLQFNQTGFSLQYSVSKDTLVRYYSVNESDAQEEVFFGDGSLCLKSPGLYTLVPKSCHKFEKDAYMFDTLSPTVVSMKAVGHAVKTAVVASKRDEQISLRIRSLRFGSGDVVVQPLEEVQQTDNESSDVLWKYSFSFVAKPLDEVEVVPMSSELMFSPHTYRADISEDCPQVLPSFQASPGLMVVGHVTPALEGVAIVIQLSNNETLRSTTNEKGSYRAGPLHGGIDFTISAEMTGYVFEALPEDPHSFKTLKLSGINILVASSDSSPLPNVLLSLSTSKFRSNNFTTESGLLEYRALNPGQYFIKPFLREYEFSPNSKIVDLAEGESEDVHFIGTRVAFSCSGVVTTLNRLPLSDITVVGKGVAGGSCQSYSESTDTDSTGSYQLRGMMPDCDYNISVETGHSSYDVANTLPLSTVVKVTDSDVTDGGDFIVVFGSKSIFITGNVLTSEQSHLETLKLQVSSEVKVGSALQSVSVDAAGFFDFAPLPMLEKGGYVVSLDTTLSSHYYKTSTAEERAPGNRDTHITFHFQAEEVFREQDSQRGSVFALLFAVIVVFALVNIEKIFSAVQGFMNSSNNHHDSSADSRRRRR